MYYALSQHDQAIVYVVARTKSDPTQFLKPITQASLSVGLQVPLAPFTYENWINLMLILQRIIATCATGLSALGMLLAVIGLFGAVSYSVSERKKELGIRVALGARPAQLLQMVLKQTLRIAGAGVVIGIALGVGATVLLESQFYQIGTVEWSVLIPVSLGMLAVAAVVAYLSARPWLRINPMEAVRHS
jgi:putative ABC transport system permease protein